MMISPRCGKAIRPVIVRYSKSRPPIGFRIRTWPYSMRAADLGSRRVAVWGLGREGRAAIGFLRKHHPKLPLMLLDDNAGDRRPQDEVAGGVEYAFGADRIASAIEDVDIIVKSPGGSLYRREIQSAQRRGVH